MKTNHSIPHLKPALHTNRSFFKSYFELAFLGSLLIATQASAASLTWNGGASPSPNWSASGNWVGGVAPVNGDDVTFLNAAGNPLASAVDTARSINSITRNATDASASIMAISTLNNLAVSSYILSSGGMTITGPIPLANDLNIWRASGTGTLEFTNAPGDTVGISGPHIINFTNVLSGSPGAFLLMANPLSTWSGGAYIQFGNVRIGNVSSTGSPGAPTAGPLGTGTVTIGTPGSANFGTLSFQGSANLTLHNNILVNSSGGIPSTRTIANNLTAPLKLTLNGGLTNSENLYLTGVANNTTRLDGPISGTGGLVINSASLNALLTGNNSYGGGTLVLGNASLGFGSNTSLGTGPVTFGSFVGDAQIFSYAVNGPRTIANDITIRTIRYIVGAGTVDGLAGNDQVFNGTVTMDHGAANVRDIVLQKNLTINGELKGSIPDNNALRVTGGGKVTLTGVNSYTGGTFIDSATVNINADAALGADPGSPAVNVTFSGAGGTLQVGAATVALSANRNLALNSGVSATIDTGANNLIVNGVMSGGGNLTKTGSGTLTLTGTGNAISGYAFLDGNLVVDGGTFYDGLELLVGWTAPGTMTVTGFGSSAQAITLRPGASGTFNLESGATLTVDQIYALVPTSANTIVNFDGGTLVPWGVQPARFPNYISALTHAYIKAGGLTLNTAASTLTSPQGLEHDPALGATPDGGLTKTGTGDLYLTGTNTYTGPTTISSGRLIVTTTGGAKGDYTVADTATDRVTVTRAGTTLTNASLALGLFMSSTLEIDLNNLGLPSTPPIRVNGALTPSGTVNVAVKGLALSTTGVFPLIKYGTLGGDFGSFSLAPIPNVTATLSNDTANAMIDLVITDVNYPKWKGNISSDWDISTTANWVGVVSGAPTVYQEPSIPGAPVLFNDTANTGSVNLTTTVSPYSMTVSNNTLNYSFGGLGSVSGPGGLTKNGTAQLTLGTVNSFSGPVTVNAGTVLASAVNALGSGGALTVNNATVNIGNYNQTAGPVALTNGNILGTNGVLTASGYTLASGTVSAHLANGSLTKAGSGTVSLTASNNIGVTTIDGGVLRVTDPNALGLGGFDGAKLTAINSGGALLYDGTITTDEHIWLAGAGPDGFGALRATNGTVTIGQHTFMPTNATINVGAGASLVRGGSLYTVVTNLLTLTKRGAGAFWEYGSSSAYIPMDVVEGTLGVGGTVGGSVTVRSNATLAGAGVISGAVTVQPGGTLSPGASIGTLTINNNLTLQGTNIMEIAKNSGVTANDQVKGIITLTAGGTLIVTNVGTDPLTAGDTFQLFIAATNNVAFAAVTLPTLSGLSWANNLAVNGTIQVVSTVPPQFGGVARLNDGNIHLTGTGPVNAGYRVFATTNVAQPFSNWLQVGTGTFTGGVLSFTDLQATNYARRFYRTVTP